MLTYTLDTWLLSEEQDLIKGLGDNWRKRVRENSLLDVEVRMGSRRGQKVQVLWPDIFSKMLPLPTELFLRVQLKELSHGQLNKIIANYEVFSRVV